MVQIKQNFEVGHLILIISQFIGSLKFVCMSYIHTYTNQ